MKAGYGPLSERIDRAEFANKDLPVTLATLTSHWDLPQAIASILSFRTAIGRPKEIVVTDDGTLTDEDHWIVRLLGPETRVYTPSVDPHLPCSELLAHYAATMPLGRKLAMLIELSSSPRATLVYADSDVLFLSPEHLGTILTEPVVAPRYMTDPNRAAFDDRVDTSRLEPVNSGFLIVPAGMVWTEALETGARALQAPQWYTEQTIVSVAINANQGSALPPDRYVLRWDDRHGLRDKSGPAAVVRHYVAPVRWRFWIKAHGGYGRAVRHSVGPLIRLISEEVRNGIKGKRP